MPPGIRKLYSSIREVSEATGLKPHVLRFWEQEFPMLRPKKNRAGNRVYTARDIQVVERIQDLLKREKYTIEGARQVMDREARQREAVGPDGDVRRDLTRLRAFLEDVRDGLG